MSKDLFFDEQEQKGHEAYQKAEQYEDQRNSEFEEYISNKPAISEISPGTILRLTKQNVTEFHEQMKTMIFDAGYGMFEYLEVIKFFGKLNDVIFGTQGKEGDEDFLSAVVDEIKKHGKEFYTARGVKFELAETGTKYDYSHNPAWKEIEKEAKAVADKKSALEERLKKIPAGSVQVEKETGETLIGPSKSSKSSFKVIFSK